jgi:hypothetical protein
MPEAEHSAKLWGFSFLRTLPYTTKPEPLGPWVEALRTGRGYIHGAFLAAGLACQL